MLVSYFQKSCLQQLFQCSSFVFIENPVRSKGHTLIQIILQNIHNTSHFSIEIYWIIFKNRYVLRAVRMQLNENKW